MGNEPLVDYDGAMKVTKSISLSLIAMLLRCPLQIAQLSLMHIRPSTAMNLFAALELQKQQPTLSPLCFSVPSSLPMSKATPKLHYACCRNSRALPSPLIVPSSSSAILASQSTTNLEFINSSTYGLSILPPSSFISTLSTSIGGCNPNSFANLHLLLLATPAHGPY